MRLAADPSERCPGPGPRARGRSGPVDFAVIGAMRAGTTTLHSLLSRHPDIAMSRDKETDYFIVQKNYPRGPAWYDSQFDPARPIRGEVSPNYSKGRDFPGVPARLAADCPDARLIYVVRDPVMRAVSQYTHSWCMGELLLSPAEMARTDEYLSLIDASSYARQLDLWRDHFPPSRILVVDFDRLLTDPQQQIARILDHVGARPVALGEMGRHNDAEQLSRIPRPLIRLARGGLRPLLTTLLSQRSRDRLRRLMAIGPGRSAPDFPPGLLRRMQADLAGDADRLRRMTGMEFAQWSI